MTHTSPAVLTKNTHGVWLAVINRPAMRNALAPDVVAGLRQVIADVQADAQARALVIRGAEGFFCAGGSIGGFRERLQADADKTSPSADPIAQNNRQFGQFMTAYTALEVPVIAMVEGGAFGGGVGLACGADIVLATADARFSLSETSLGIIPAQIAPFVVARIGARLTRRLGLTGEKVQGESACALGLVDELAPNSEALDRLTLQWINRIANCAPRANRAHKRLVADAMSGAPLNEVLDRAASSFADCMRDEGQDGTAAFRDKRAPLWRTPYELDALRIANVEHTP